MKITKSELISIYTQSIGREAATKLITNKIKAAFLEDKTVYTQEEIIKIISELMNEGGLVKIAAQAFSVRLERKKFKEKILQFDKIKI